MASDQKMALSLGNFFNTKKDPVDKLFFNRHLAKRKRLVTPPSVTGYSERLKSYLSYLSFSLFTIRTIKSCIYHNSILNFQYPIFFQM